ncbi:hypothetical protein GCM10017744_054520 [Streptomyces antimycoticus]|uniref:Uncharacterized protein n=1 Tax=Streptomyces antimycoticus TaxID=68175 RepID=A0A499V2F9_9ACTN|nr:hypothetical protein SSPO_052940 [Streptomyces antimycoticus]
MNAGTEVLPTGSRRYSTVEANRGASPEACLEAFPEAFSEEETIPRTTTTATTTTKPTKSAERREVRCHEIERISLSFPSLAPILRSPRPPPLPPKP